MTKSVQEVKCRNGELLRGEIHNVLYLLYRDKKLCVYHTINLVFLLISTDTL